MSQEHDDALHQQPSIVAPSSDMGTPKSDTAFPSVLLMGLCLVLVIALVGITGWKVLLLDQEREEIRKDQAILARNVDAFKQYSGELPQLEKRYGELTASVAQLEGTQKGLQQTVDKLSQQRQTLAEESARLSGDNTEITSRVNAARTELGQIQAELANAKPLAASAKQELATLQSQEAALRASITEKQIQVATLTSDVQGLERSRTHAQDLLTRMTEDQKALEGFRKTVDSMAAQLQASLAKADAASNEYARQSTNVQTATRNLDAETAAMHTRLQTLENNIAALERHSSSFSQILTLGGSSNQALQAQIQTLTSESKQLETTLRALDSQVQQWTQRAEAPLEKVNEMEAKLLPMVNSLTNSLQSIVTQANAFESQVKKAETGVFGIQKAVGTLEQQVQTLAVAAAELQSGARLSNDNGEALSKLIGKMQQDLDTLAAAIATLQTHKQESPSGNQ